MSTATAQRPAEVVDGQLVTEGVVCPLGMSPGSTWANGPGPFWRCDGCEWTARGYSAERLRPVIARHHDEHPGHRIVERVEL